MQFCPNCDNVLLVRTKQKKKYLACTCGYQVAFDKEFEDQYTITNKGAAGSEALTLIVPAKVKDADKVTDEDREANDDLFEPYEED
jgi:DNA-directed RNA polymerase subunit M/transcription elongation factor TFIIS